LANALHLSGAPMKRPGRTALTTQWSRLFFIPHDSIEIDTLNADLQRVQQQFVPLILPMFFKL